MLAACRGRRHPLPGHDITSPTTMQVPALLPELFRDAYELTVDVFEGTVRVPAARLARTGERARAWLGAEVSPFQRAMLYIAGERFGDDGTFFSYVSRAEAFGEMVSDPRAVDGWVARGWARRSVLDGGSFAPRKFLLDTAGTCPLDDAAAGFDRGAFARIAAVRAADAGFP